MVNFILSCLYFFLPAYFTNMTPPLAKKLGILKFLDKPVDFKMKFKGKRVFGSHKTWRGILAGLILGTTVAFIQSLLYTFPSIQDISFFNYQQINVLFFGLLMSGGALVGDLMNSFLKRRVGIKPGGKFLPLDQTNYVIGAGLFLTLFGEIDISILVWVTLFTLTFFIHIIFNRLGYHLNIHQAKW
ncbi:MAG: CDP-archaeol synthase [Candidatus Nealsonbacteria bacterium]|nr:CDP-archaeol synthase [Candidatus Nealsonbacteria bacterium]